MYFHPPCEPESAHRSNVVAFSRKYTKIEFGADVFVLKVNRAERERFNMNSVRVEGMYLGVNLRQRGMIVKVGSGIYIRSNVVAKPKNSNSRAMVTNGNGITTMTTQRRTVTMTAATMKTTTMLMTTRKTKTRAPALTMIPAMIAKTTLTPRTTRKIKA